MNKGKKGINKESAYIASSKVIIFKLGINEAAILATLIYKKNYWQEQKGLTKFKGHDCFFISQLDIELENCLKKGVISSAINTLINNDLIKVFRQGLGKPNCYYVNESVILAYEKKHYMEYKEWQAKKIANKKKAVPMSTKKVEMNASRSTNSEDLEVLKEHATNNKNTNNKNTKQLTNHINVAVKSKVFNPDEVALADLIENDFFSDETEREKNVIATYNFLIEMVPQFHGFTHSTYDLAMVEELFDYKIYPYNIAGKLIANAKRIVEGTLESRFGNLFVGLDEMNQRMEAKY
jgi:hypothetical protein